MNDYLLSILFGIVEGLTEFLPVSSTAHLRIAQAISGVDLENDFWKMYTVVIQLGAVLCLPVYFWRRIVKFARTFPRGESGNRTILTHPLSLTMIAFVTTAIPALLLAPLISENLESLYVIGLALLIGGVVMWAVDARFGETAQDASAADAAMDAPSSAPDPRSVTIPPAPDTASRSMPSWANQTRSMEQMTVLQAIWIGLVQVLSAVFPGTSRSMSTIAAGQTAGLTRAAALEFSFFVSIPVMFAATLFDLLSGLKDIQAGTIPPMSTENWIVLAIGFVVSFIVALGVVAWFMHWVRKRGFVPFAIYRIIVGIGVLIWAMNT